MAEPGRLSGKKALPEFFKVSRHHLVSQGKGLFRGPYLSLPRLKYTQLFL